jgi:hypothetical protein
MIHILDAHHFRRQIVTLRSRHLQNYIHILERRLLEIVPDHVIPVTEEHFGLPVTSLSKLANAIVGSLGAPSGPGAPGSMVAKASHMLAATATHRKESADAADTIKKLEKSVRSLQDGYNGAITILTDCRAVE